MIPGVKPVLYAMESVRYEVRPLGMGLVGQSGTRTWLCRAVRDLDMAVQGSQGNQSGTRTWLQGSEGLGHSCAGQLETWAWLCRAVGDSDTVVQGSQGLGHGCAGQ